MTEISIRDFCDIQIGQAEDIENGTGVTVLISKAGMPAGIDVRGGGPASRETTLLSPVSHADRIHAIVLSGGSAFGLDSAGGVMKYLEERNIGYNVGITHVPLVCCSCLFDLGAGNAFVRPDAEMGYHACVNSEVNNYEDGCRGAGTGATVGKLRGMAQSMKSGIGSYAVRCGELEVGAIVCVNALGDVFDMQGKKIAGLLSPDQQHFEDSSDLLFQMVNSGGNRFVANTTIGIIITNAGFDKTKLCKIAAMGQNGIARSVRPVHTSADGDTLYAVSAGNLQANYDVVGSLAADVVQKAIIRAVMSAKGAYGIPSMHDINLHA